jgi:hypothetical protein
MFNHFPPEYRSKYTGNSWAHVEACTFEHEPLRGTLRLPVTAVDPLIPLPTSPPTLTPSSAVPVQLL